MAADGNHDMLAGRENRSERRCTVHLVHTLINRLTDVSLRARFPLLHLSTSSHLQADGA